MARTTDRSDPDPDAAGRTAPRPGPRRWLAAALAALIAALVAAVPGPGARAESAPLVFAAASLTEAMTAVADAYAGRTGDQVRLSFAASSALARQIENGAPADLFVSANRVWMDRLAAAALVVPESRVDIAGNTILPCL